MAFIPLARIVAILGQYGYAVLLPIAVVEGPAMAVIAGALVASGQMNGVVACVLLVLADLVGDAGYYGLGRFGHAPLLARISKRLSLDARPLRPAGAAVPRQRLEAPDDRQDPGAGLDHPLFRRAPAACRSAATCC